MQETQRAFDAEPERELINLLRESGASDAFITLLKTNSEDVGVERNSCRAEINKWVRWNDGEINEEAVRELSFGGGFFKEMWNGELYNAFKRADSSNKAILTEAFGLAYINSQRPAGRPKVTA
jgi:hypothetical protein